MRAICSLTDNWHFTFLYIETKIMGSADYYVRKKCLDIMLSKDFDTEFFTKLMLEREVHEKLRQMRR